MHFQSKSYSKNDCGFLSLYSNLLCHSIPKKSIILGLLQHKYDHIIPHFKLNLLSLAFKTLIWYHSTLQGSSLTILLYICQLLIKPFLKRPYTFYPLDSLHLDCLPSQSTPYPLYIFTFFYRLFQMLCLSQSLSWPPSSWWFLSFVSFIRKFICNSLWSY